MNPKQHHPMKDPTAMSPLSSKNNIIQNTNHEPSSESSLLLADSTALLIVDVNEENWHAAKQDFSTFPTKLKSAIANCRRMDAKIIWVMDESGQNPQQSIFGGNRKRFQRKAISSQPLPKPQNDDLVVTKKGLSGTSQTRLLSLLQHEHIDTVLVCGLYTSVCVQHTAFGVFEKGFRTILVEDACADRTRKRHQAATSLYGNYMYEMVQSSDLEPKRTGLWKQPRFSVLEFVVETLPRKAFCDDASDSSLVTNVTEVSSSTSDSISDSSHPEVSQETSSPGLSKMAMMTTMMIVTAMATAVNQRVILSSR